eukprot:403338541
MLSLQDSASLSTSSSSRIGSPIKKLLKQDFEKHRLSQSFKGISMHRDKGLIFILALIIGCRCTVASFIEKCNFQSSSEYIVQAMLLIIVGFLYFSYQYQGHYKQYIHLVAIPFLLTIVAKKHYDRDESHFHLGECFCTFLLIMVFSSLNSPLKYYTVQAINILCIGTFYIIMLFRYGLKEISFEFYHNMSISLALIAFIHKQKESLSRINFINNSLSQMKERKWKSILSQLTEGVLILEQSESQDKPQIFFSNQSLIELVMNKANRQNIITKRTLQQPKEFFSLHQQNKILQTGESSEQYFQDDKIQTKKSLNVNNKDEKLIQQEHLTYSHGANLNSDTSQNQSNRQQTHKLSEYIHKLFEDIKESKTGSIEKQFIKISNSKKVLELQITKIEDSNPQVLFLFKEVSSYKKLQFTKTKEKFTNLFLNTTAHNLFTPINGMIGISQMLENEVQNNPQALRYIGMVNNCLSGLVFTVHNIMELSKIRLKNFRSKARYINIYEKIETIFDIFEDQIVQKNIYINSECSDILINTDIEIDEPSVKYTRPQDTITIKAKLVTHNEMLSQIDLLKRDIQQDCGGTNSNYQTGSDMSLLSMTSPIGYGSQEQGEYLKMSITDTGLGMKEDVIKGLFQLFGNAKMSNNNINQQGIGLGLTVSSQICKQLGGSLHIVRSQPQIGTKLVFFLPVQMHNHLENTFSNINQINQNRHVVKIQVDSDHTNSQYISSQSSRSESFIARKQNANHLIINTEMSEDTPIQRRSYRLTKKVSKKKGNLKSQFCKNDQDMDLLEQDPSFSDDQEDIKESLIANYDSEDEIVRAQSDSDLQVRSFQEMKNPFASFSNSNKNNGSASNDPLEDGYNSVESPIFQKTELQIQSSSTQLGGLFQINNSNKILETKPSDILIVDDTVFNIEVLQMMFFNQYELTCDVAFSGEEALRKIQERTFKNDMQPYKLVIMDINMPGMDGVICNKKLKQFFFENYIQDPSYVVAHTAIPQEQFGDYNLKGFDDFLSKPVFSTKLDQIVFKVLGVQPRAFQSMNVKLSEPLFKEEQDQNVFKRQSTAGNNDRFYNSQGKLMQSRSIIQIK